MFIYISITDSVAYGSYTIPNHADLLIYSAAYNGFYSFRSPSKGSWLIQALCRELKKAQPDDDLNTILTNVSFYVAIEKESNVPDMPILHRKKQIPLKQDTLIRKVYLKGQPGDVVKNTNGIVASSNLNLHRSQSRDKCLCM